jgi:hypothetical protein
MGDLNLKGTLNLMGSLTLKADGGKVKVDNKEVLVEVLPSGTAQSTAAPPVIMPPPPASPTDPAPQVRIINSFNKTVKIGQGGSAKNVVTGGMVMEGSTPTWPGMMIPGSATVTVSFLPINVVGDKAVIFPTGAPATFTVSGQ